MPEPVWTSKATADLMAIVDYVADDNPDAALALLGEIEARVGRLGDHSGVGRKGRVPGTRELVVRPNYLVVYSAGADAVIVLRVLHAAQMWP